MEIIYIENKLALQIYSKTIEHSGGGSAGVRDSGQLECVLEMVRNDDYYPTFFDKLVYLIFSINRSHCFTDGNKRISITLAAQFMLLNGYMAITKRFFNEMENISYHLAAGKISKELLEKIVASFLDGDDDFSEELKFEIFLAISE
jgi:death on curing protein